MTELIYHREFSTLAEFASFAEEHTVDADSCSFTELPRVAETAAIARRGWQEGAERSAAVVTRLGDIAASKLAKHDPFYAVEGLELDVGSYVSGRPECWLDVQEQFVPVSGRVVVMTISLSCSGGVTTEQLIQRGIMAAAAVSALEAAGRSVELWARIGGVENRGVGGTGKAKPYKDAFAAEVCASVCIKRAGQPLDLGVVSFACAHPAMYRRLGFSFLDYCAYKEGFHGVKGGSNGTYGHVAHTPPELDGDIAVPALALYKTGGSATDQQILDWIREALRSQGVESN
jgi:hypothetical protein